MPRAPPGLSLLLMAALAFAATTNTPPTTFVKSDEKDDKLKLINPWLSACDLMQPASATDLKGACPDMWAPEPSCPPCPPDRSRSSSSSSSNSNNNTTTQCLLNYLKESHKEEVCRKGVKPEDRRSKLRALRMRHCCEHAVDTALPAEALDSDDGGATCYRMLDALLAVDALAARMSCEFAEVLHRYDCSQKYSITHQCDDCQEAYRKWVCSSMVPHYFNRTARVRPCPIVCQSVEQKCPYLLPGDRAPAHPTQYAGEPTFLCLDPNIAETGEQRLKSSVGDEDCCYTYSQCGAQAERRSTAAGPASWAMCVQCPGGPLQVAATPVNCSASITNSTSGCTWSGRSGSSSSGSRATSPLWSSSSSSSSSSTSSSSSSSFSRTLNKVLPLWTAWIILIQQILLRQHQHHQRDRRRRRRSPSAPPTTELRCPPPIRLLLPPPRIIISSITSITNTIYNLIVRNLLVNMLCACSVRTSLLLTRIKTKWRKPWS